MSSREATPGPGTSAASSGQAAPQDESQESAACPECRGISTACSSSCRHCFCRLCLWDWNLGQAACPRCRRPTRHRYPQHVPLYHEVQDRVYRAKRRRRARSCSGETRPRRAMRWPRDGSPRSRRWQRRAREEDAAEEGGTPRFEWAVPASSREQRSRRASRRSWSHREGSRGQRGRSRGRERSHGWDRRQSRVSRRHQDAQRGSHGRSAGRRCCRSWDADGRRAPRPRHDVPSERSEAHPWEDPDSSRQWHTGRRQTRRRSHRRGQNSQAASQGRGPCDHVTNQRRWRSWNADRHSPRPQRGTPSRRSGRRQWEDRDPSRHQRTTRSRTRGRSQRRGQNSQAASQGTGPRNRSTRQRQCRSWNASQGRAPRSQQDIPGSSGRSRHRRRSWSRARHRDA